MEIRVKRFSEYMNEWLYSDDGYYAKFRDIGKSGDFYTAVSTSRFFGASIANNFLKLLDEGRASKDAWIIEIGAHRGYMISDMIEWIYGKNPSLIETLKFATVERMDSVAEAQRDYFKDRFGDDVKIHQFKSIDEIKGAEYIYFVSNEIFDAFACELYNDGRLAYIEQEAILWQEAEDRFKEFAKRYNLIRGEIPIGYEDFAKSVANSAKRVDFVTFDYGEEYVRNDFSIRVYEEHKTLPFFDEELDLKRSFKRADITYDVNFGYLQDVFNDAGLKKLAYMTQAKALIEFGLIDMLSEYASMSSYNDYLRQAERVKTLISPTIMGDRFKMLWVRKG